MNNEKRDELKELSLPALRHVELVQLARTESPNKAHELASLRWPRRQAKATRSLAILRRDFGIEALESLSLEHARPQGSEHAQTKEKNMKLDTLYPEGVQNVLLVHNERDVVRNRLNTLTLQFHGGEKLIERPFSDEVKMLGLDSESTKTFVRRVCNSMLDQWASPKVGQWRGGLIWSSALMAVRAYVPEDKGLIKKLINAVVVYQGGYAHYATELAEALFQEGIIGHSQTVIPEPQRVFLQRVIDYLLEIGFTEKEVQDMWLEMLQTRVRTRLKTWYIISFWRGLKIGSHDIKEYVGEIAQWCLLRELKDILVDGGMDWNPPPRYTEFQKAPEDFIRNEIEFLVYQTSDKWREQEDVQELLESYFITAIARGKVSTAFYFLVRFGSAFRLYYFDGRRTTDKDSPNTAMEKLMRGAISKAVELRNFGIASTLAEYVGDTVQADEFRETARTFNQRVALDFSFFLEVKHG